MTNPFVSVGCCIFRDADGTRTPAISSDLLKSSLLVHTVGAVCMRLRAHFFMKKTYKKTKARARSCAVYIGSKTACYFIAISKFSQGPHSSSLLQSARSPSTEPEAEHKDTCVLSCDCCWFAPMFEGMGHAGKTLCVTILSLGCFEVFWSLTVISD